MGYFKDLAISEMEDENPIIEEMEDMSIFDLSACNLSACNAQADAQAGAQADNSDYWQKLARTNDILEFLARKCF